MPTLIKIDSFQHQVLRVVDRGALADDWYSQITDAGTTAPSHGGGNITFDTGIKRTASHVNSLKVVHSNTVGIQVRNTLAAGTRDANISFYFRTVDTTNPGEANCQLFQFGSSTNGLIELSTNGEVTAQVGAGTTQTGASDVCDGEWHRIDARYQTSTTTGALDVQVDGVAITQATATITAADITDWNFGGTSATLDYTIYYSDFVMSATGADYPMGDHFCGMLVINSTGTHSQGSGAFEDETGEPADADLLDSVDDAWDGTTPELSQTGDDHVKQTANDGAGYVEWGFTDASGMDTIWGAQLGVLMAADSSTTACNATALAVDSGGTTRATTGSVDPSNSSSVYNGYRVPFTAAPNGSWSQTNLNGCKVRFGFSTDAAPDPIFNAAIIEYAGTVAEAGGDPLQPVVMVIGL